MDSLYLSYAFFCIYLYLIVNLFLFVYKIWSGVK